MCILITWDLALGGSWGWRGLVESAPSWVRMSLIQVQRQRAWAPPEEIHLRKGTGGFASQSPKRTAPFAYRTPSESEWVRSTVVTELLYEVVHCLCVAQWVRGQDTYIPFLWVSFPSGPLRSAEWSPLRYRVGPHSLFICFTRSSVYTAVPIPPTLPPPNPVSTHLFSTSGALFLLCK